MTTIAILADPPRERAVLPSFSPSPLSVDEATDLYRAMLADVAVAADRSGGETLVNYREADGGEGPSGDEESTDAESAVRDVVDAVLDSLEEVRFEVQVGSTRYARVGNTITHLLEREGTDTAAVVEPTAPFLTRSVIDSAAMKLRSADVVLGPTTEGRVYYAGFDEPIDFTDAFETPAVETLTERAREEGLSVDFLPTLPVIEGPGDLLTAIPAIRSRRAAERIHPTHTAATVEDFGLHVRGGESGPELVRE